MKPLIGAVILVLLGLLGARLSFATKRAPLGPRLVLSTGTHFLFLGFLLGSQGIGLLSRSIIDQLYPLLALGLGWIGLLFGLQLDRRHLGHFPPAYLAVAFGQALLAFLLFLGLAALLLGAARPLTQPVIATLVATAATASISTPVGIALISNTFRVRGKVSQLLFFIASLDGVVGILALQLAYAFYHPLRIGEALPMVGTVVWLVIALVLGLIFGIFFLWFTRPRPEREELTLFLLGLVVLAAGTALYLGLSPLFLSMITGAVVANLSPLRRQIYVLLQAWEQPIYVILLILAGALLDLSTWLVVPLAVIYLLIRAIAKVAGGFAASRLVRLPFATPAALGVGLIPQGGISLAMAISITLTYGALRLDGLALAEVLFGTIVLGVVASELVGPFLIRNLLRQVGEISPRMESALARPEAGEAGGGRARGPAGGAPERREE